MNSRDVTTRIARPFSRSARAALTIFGIGGQAADAAWKAWKSLSGPVMKCSIVEVSHSVPSMSKITASRMPPIVSYRPIVEWLIGTIALADRAAYRQAQGVFG